MQHKVLMQSCFREIFESKKKLQGPMQIFGNGFFL